MRNLLLCISCFSALLFMTASDLNAEPPEYQELRDGDGADRWLLQQLERADTFEREGKYLEAEEIRKFADLEHIRRKGLGKLLEETLDEY